MCVRLAAATWFVTHEPVAGRKRLKPRPPYRAFEIVIDMAQPVRRPQDHRPLSARRDGDAGAVGRGTEPYALAELHRLRISQRNVSKQANRSARFSLVLPLAIGRASCGERGGNDG